MAGEFGDCGGGVTAAFVRRTGENDRGVGERVGDRGTDEHVVTIYLDWMAFDEERMRWGVELICRGASDSSLSLYASHLRSRKHDRRQESLAMTTIRSRNERGECKAK